MSGATVLQLDRPVFRTPDASAAKPMAQSHFRLMVLMLLFMLVTAAIGLRLIQLALFSDDDGGARAAVAGPRGDILDRNGVPLATTINTWTIALNPSAVLGDRAALAAKLAVLLPAKSEADYARMLATKRKFIYLGKRVPPELVAKLHAIGEPGLIELRIPERLYPQAYLAGHVLGYAEMVAVDDPKARAANRVSNKHELTGTGVERYFYKELAGGNSLQLAIDSRVQAAVEGELGRRMTETSAAGAAAVVMDVDSGEVVAMASLPSINPNKPMLLNDDIKNKATGLVYELGSTFKMLTFANAIESGVITDFAKTYDVSHNIQIGRFTIHDDEHQGRRITVPEVMTFSSNIGTAQIAEEIGPQRIQSFFRKLGFYERSDIELRERAMPLVPHYWARTTVMTTAFGHGIAVSPLHLAEAYAALANGGIWHRATLLKAKPGQQFAGKRVISEETSAKMRKLMRLVVLEGTGTNANAPGLRVGGKTGTAEKISGHGYNKHSNITVFAGAFPMDHPRYVILTMLDDAKASKATSGWKTAGWMTAPLTKRIVRRIGPLLGIQPDAGKDLDVSDLMPLLAEKKVPHKNEIE